MTTVETTPTYLPGPVSGYVYASKMPWTPVPGIPESGFKLLRVDRETGANIALLRVPPGVQGPRHKHYASGEYYVVKGSMEFGGQRVEEGDYWYELGGFTHTEDPPEEEVILLTFSHGPIQVLNADGSWGPVIDIDKLIRAVERHQAELSAQTGT